MAHTAISPWQIACLAKELRHDRPLAVTLDNRPLVLFRDAAGAPVALEDRCAHRNAPLSLGRVRSGLLECIYHGWRYDRSGRVAEIPALVETEAQAELHQADHHPAVEQQGFIWVSLNDAAPAQPPPSFANFPAPGWTSFVMKTRFRAPIEACLENFLDVPHATFLHRYWFRAPTRREVKVRVRTLVDGAEAEFFDEPREKSLVWWLLAPRDGVMRHTDRFIAPRTSRVDYEFPGGLRYIITSSCSVSDALSTIVYTVISFRFPRLGWLVRGFFRPLARRIIRQDVDMLDAQYANIRRFGAAAFVSTRADLLGRHINAWSSAVRDGMAPPSAGEVQDVVIRL